MKFTTVTESVTHRLKCEIITGALAAGEKLNEADLAERIGISRPPLREAFRKLEHENLVVSIPRKGVYVADMSAEDCAQISRARKMIEGAAVDFFAEKRIRRLPLAEKSLIASQRFYSDAPVSPRDVLAHHKVMSDFHTMLVISCDNSWLIHLFQSLTAGLARYQLMYLNQPGSSQASIAEHASVLERIRAEKYEDAKQQLNDHIDRTVQRLKSKMNDEKEG